MAIAHPGQLSVNRPGSHGPLAACAVAHCGTTTLTGEQQQREQTHERIPLRVSRMNTPCLARMERFEADEIVEVTRKAAGIDKRRLDFDDEFDEIAPLLGLVDRVGKQAPE